jgi:hypothetical protein
VERSREADGQDGIPLLDRELVDWRHMLDAGAVYQQVDAAELGQCAPIQEVEPVTRAVFPLNMSDSQFIDERRSGSSYVAQLCLSRFTGGSLTPAIKGLRTRSKVG